MHLITQTCNLYINIEYRERFRYSGVDRANASHTQLSTKAMAMHCNNRVV